VLLLLLRAVAPDLSLDSVVNKEYLPRLRVARKLSDTTNAHACGLAEEYLNGTSSVNSEAASGEHLLEEIISFLCFCFVICCMLDHLNLTVPFQYRLPFSVVLSLCGIVVSLFMFEVIEGAQEDGFFLFEHIHILVDGTLSAAAVDPHIVFYIFLPPLLYESASNLSAHVLVKVLSSSLLLALPGVILNIGLTALIVRYTVQPSSMTWEAALLLSSILSATDPVAVVAALHHLGAPKKLSTLIEGESLLNDGSAVVFFFVFLDLVMKDAPADVKQCPTPSFGCITGFFLKLALGGPLLGLLVSWITARWVGAARRSHSPRLEVVIIFSAVYSTFVIAEALHVSGVLAVVTLGSQYDSTLHTRLSAEGRHAHHMWFSLYSYMCNQAIFFISGLVCFRFIFEDPCLDLWKKGSTWLELGMLYIVIHITRSTVVTLFYPLLSRWGYGLTRKEAFLLVFGGLRGAVGLAMGLIVEHSEYVDRETASIIAFHTSGIVLLTLLINGSFVDEVYERLDPYPLNPFKMTLARKALARAEEECRHIIKRAKQDWFFNDVDFHSIVQCVPDLQQIDFDEAGVPQPTGIKNVTDTLTALAHTANAIDHERVVEDEHHLPFRHRYLARKGHVLDHSVQKAGLGSASLAPMAYPNDPDNLRTWLTSGLHAEMRMGSADEEDRTDDLIRFKECGTSVLEYTATKDLSSSFGSRRSSRGLYVSARPVAAVSEEDDEFKMEVRECLGCRILVGVVYQRKMGRRPSDGSKETRDTTLFGTQCGVLYSCSDGVMQEVTEDGREEVLVGEQGIIQVGETIQISVLDSGANCVIAFTSQSGVRLAESLLEDASAEELFPAIEVVPGTDDSITSALTSRSQRSLRSQKTGGAVLEKSVTGILQAGGKTLQTGKSFMNSTASVGKSLVSTAAKLPGVVATFRMASGEESPKSPSASGSCPPSPSSPSRGVQSAKSLLSDVSKEDTRAVVRLSFELKTFTATQSHNEIFHMLFNAIVRQYELMHSKGTLSSGVLLRLNESISNAEDCADHERNSDTATLLTGKRNAQSIFNRLTTFGMDTGSMVKDFQKEVDARLGRMLATLGRRSSIKEDGEDAQRNHFEPLLVEYLIVDNFVAHQTMWSQLSAALFRDAGFPRDKEKIELLWAFIEAHTKAVKSLHNFKRQFPELSQRLRGLISECKHNLAILQDIMPQRFYFVKHYLALRVILTMKMEMILQFASDGWIPKADGQGLIDDIRERLNQMEQFRPHVGSHVSFRDAGENIMGLMTNFRESWSEPAAVHSSSNLPGAPAGMSSSFTLSDAGRASRSTSQMFDSSVTAEDLAPKVPIGKHEVKVHAPARKQDPQPPSGSHPPVMLPGAAVVRFADEISRPTFDSGKDSEDIVATTMPPSLPGLREAAAVQMDVADIPGQTAEVSAALDGEES